VSNTGPLTARVYLRALALVSLAAWLSIGVQLRLLIGEGGLLPIAPLLDEARRLGIPFFELPTLFWLDASDHALVLAVALGASASAFGLLRPGRSWLCLSLPLYLSVSVAAQDFCSFQWDHLLVEASFLALFLDWRRPSTAAVWMPRLLLFKLYFESGVAKLLSPIGDWISGSAMVAYFETAPIPTPLGRVMHTLPVPLLHLTSWLTLALELVVPLFVFGPRALRRAAFVLLSSFQVLNMLTANYGFFVPLSLALHLWLLDDETLARLRLGRLLPAAPASPRARRVGAAVLAIWLALSLGEAQLSFAGEPPEGSLRARLLEIYLGARVAWAPLRLAGVYHLFASVTTDRIEPILEVQTEDGGPFIELALRYKPGPIERPPPFVAPHQPRVDFQMWFHGLAARGRLPTYLLRLEESLCRAPARVAPLFAGTLPSTVRAVRLRYARYRMTAPGAPTFWRREDLFARPTLLCDGPEREEEARR
jgi:hypothetical protein